MERSVHRKKYSHVVVVAFFIYAAIPVAAITPKEFIYNIEHYFEDKDSLIIEDTIEIYSSGEKIPLAIDSMIFMFFNGIKKYEPEKYKVFSTRVLQINNARLMRVVEVIERYDLNGYITNIKPNPTAVDNLLTLYFSSGDPNFLDILYQFIQDNYSERIDKDKYLAARAATWSISSLLIDYPSVLDSFKNNKILSSELMNYIQNTDAETIKSETKAFIKEQRDKGIWK